MVHARLYWLGVAAVALGLGSGDKPSLHGKMSPCLITVLRIVAESQEVVSDVADAVHWCGFVCFNGYALHAIELDMLYHWRGTGGTIK
jgi:hypothetical protein